MAKYIWPVPAWTGINQLFGTYPGGFNPPGGHTGTDYGTPIGTPIRAIADGVVLHADWGRGNYWDNPWLVEPSFAGIYVVIDHGECLSLYAHMNDTPLNLGDRVRQGQVIGGSGNTRDGASVFGPHLHFEILPDGWSVNNGTYGRVNPALYCTEYWGAADETIIRPQQSGTITPITPKEDTLSAAEVQAINEFTQAEIQAARATIVAEIRAGTYSGKVFAQATANANGDRVIIDHRAQVAGLVEAIKQLSSTGGAPVDLGAVLDAARRGAAEAIAEGVVKVDISIAKPDTTVGAEK